LTGKAFHHIAWSMGSLICHWFSPGSDHRHNELQFDSGSIPSKQERKSKENFKEKCGSRNLTATMVNSDSEFRRLPFMPIRRRNLFHALMIRLIFMDGATNLLLWLASEITLTGCLHCRTFVPALFHT
jgi:hypothetical protein